MNHSEYEPVTCTVVVSGLTIKGSGGTPDDIAMALGAGFSEGTVTRVTLQGHVNSHISPKTFTSSLERKKIRW